jgi:bla regulator protein BlaR1
MITYLVNFTLCSALLLLVYHLLLKNKAMYQFNRFYLLFSVVFSLIVPLIAVPRSAAPLPSLIHVQEQTPAVSMLVGESTRISPTPPIKQIDYIFYGCLVCYGLVTMLLMFRFIKNIRAITVTISTHKKIAYHGAKLVLIAQNVTPHTFLSYIFINKDDHNHKTIGNEILRHELAHASQCHSADIILIELVQIFCWFNPLLLFYRNAIRLNHEFIADAAALEASHNLTSYQSLLLNMAGQLKSLNITSQFNYSITKKRLIMMTKTTSNPTAWFTRLAILPPIAVAFLLFCNKTDAQEPVSQAKPEKVKITETAPVITRLPAGSRARVKFTTRDYPNTKEGITAVEMDEYTALEKKYATRRLDFSKTITKPEQERMEQLFQHMSREQQTDKDRAISFSYPPEPLPERHLSQAELDSWTDPAVYGVWIDGKRVKNADLKNHKPGEFNQMFFSKLSERAVKNDKFHYQIDLMTLAYYKKYREEAIANRNNSIIMFHLKS